MRMSHLPSFYASRRKANDSYAGWIGTVAAAHEGVPHPTLEDAATRLAAIAGTSTCHIAQSKDGILVPGVVRPLYLSFSSFSPLPGNFHTTKCLPRLFRFARALLIGSGAHTETQSSQDYG